MTRRIALALALLALAGTLGACGDSDVSSEATRAKDIRVIDKELLPSEVLGLQVKREDVSETTSQARNSYVDRVAMYSLRAGDLLQATLQGTRFNDEADWDNARFRRSVVATIGGSSPQAVRLGRDTVWLTTGTRQQLAVWFRGRHLMVLSTREEYPTPRTLLREALKARP